MKDFRRKTNILFTAILLAAAFLAGYVLIAGRNTENTLLFQRIAMNLQRGWYYYDDTGKRISVKQLPTTIPAHDGKAVLRIDTASLPPLAPGEEFDRFLCFYTRHQNISVRLDGRIIYHSKTATAPSWIRSYRGMYHLVALPPDFMSAHSISIESDALLHSSAGKYERVQMSSHSHLAFTILFEQHFQALLGLCLLISALFLFGTSMVFQTVVRKDYSMLFLAALAICLGLWQIEDSKILQFVTGYQPLHWCLEYLTQLVIPIFVYLFLRYVTSNSENLALKSLGSLTVLVIIVQILLQITGIAVISDTAYLSHVLYIYACVYTIFMLHHREKTIFTVALIAAFNASLFIFIIIFVMLFFTETFFSLLMSVGILITFAAMTLLTYHRVLLKAQRISKNEAKTELYKTLAFTDIATGVKNKTAWFTLIDTYKADAASPDEFALVLFDMNNLKKTNDTYGHLVGDEMIKAFANAVKDAFGDAGEVYRIGGDEFVGLCKCVSREAVNAILRAFDEAVATQPASEHPFSAAYGITFFTPHTRRDFENAVTSADGQMYEHKVAMKAART